MFDDIISAAAQTYNVPPTWIRAVIQTESSWKPAAYRAEPAIGDASYGLMQLLGKTARGLGFTGDPSLLYDPAVNIDLGTKLLGELRRSYGDDFRRIYSAYNSGKPDKYLTSTQVATHVARAVGYLEKYIREEVAILTGTAGAAVKDNPAIVALVLFVLLWAWSGKRFLV